MIKKITAVIVKGVRIPMEEFNPALLLVAEGVEVTYKPEVNNFKFTVLDTSKKPTVLDILVKGLEKFPKNDNEYDWNLAAVGNMNRIQLIKVVVDIRDDKDLSTPLKIRKLSEYKYNAHEHASEEVDIPFLETIALDAIKDLKMAVVSCKIEGCSGTYYPNHPAYKEGANNTMQQIYLKSIRTWIQIGRRES